MKNFFWQQGVTFVETLVVIAVAVPVLTIMMGAFASMSKTQARSTELENVQSAMMSVVHDLTQEIHAADQVEIGKGKRFNQLDLYSKTLEGNSISYVVSQGRLMKNSVYLTSKDVSVQLFQVENIAEDGDVGLLDFTITIASKQEPQAQVTQHLSISLRNNRKESSDHQLLDKISF